MPKQSADAASKPGMSSEVKVLALVVGLIAAGVGGYLVSNRVGSPDAAKIDKAGKAQKGRADLPSVKTNSARGMAACQKVEAAGIGSDCQSTERMVKFRIPSAPQASGAVLAFEDPVVYKMFFSSLVKENSDAAFGSAKARTVVILTGVSSVELQAKTKAVVDAL